MMNNQEKNSIQFDYYSNNYQNFEKDFYKYSSLNIPLTFLTDDILSLMAGTGNDFFMLNALNAKDKRDHFFYFKKEYLPENPNITKYIYLGVKKSE